MGDIPAFLMQTAGEVVSGFSQNFASHVYNKSDWREANEYNSPLAQKERLLAAGVSAPAASQALTGSVGNVGPSAAATPANSAHLENYIRLKELKLRERESNATVENLESQTNRTNAETNRLQQLTPIEIKKMSQDIRESVSRENLNGANAKLAELSAARIEAMTPLEIQKLVDECKLIKSQVLLTNENVRNAHAQYWVILAQERGLDIENAMKQHCFNLANELNIDPNSPWFMQLVQNFKGGDTKALDAIIDGALKSLGTVYDKTVGRVLKW